MKKNFILDTCVLINDPQCIFNFGEHSVHVPLEVIKELDRLKTESSDRGQAARAAQRALLQHLPTEPNKTKDLPNGGKIGTLMPPIETFQDSPVIKTLGDPNSADHRIIATTLWFLNQEQKTSLVTRDMGMALKARICGVPVEDYRHDKIEEKEHTHLEIPITQAEADRFYEEQLLEIEPERLKEIQPDTLPRNSYGLFIHSKRTPWRYEGFGRFVPVTQPKIKIQGGATITPRSLEQVFFLDALLNPDIHLVTASGPAGTGKTLLAMAAALQQVSDETYSGISISKVIESVGRGNGYLPGNLEEKMRPWLQPYSDALNFLHRPEKDKNQEGKKVSKRKGLPQTNTGKTPYDILTEAGVVEITAIEHIRGRSIPNRFLIIDETQNIPLSIVKTITTRLAEGSKIVFLGDPEQIDNPNLDRYTCGLSHLRFKMRDLANAAHLELSKGERSLLAEQAAKML